MFNHVVLVPFHQSKALGFIMADVPQALKEQLGEDYVCVFVPWSLNMTSGTNLFVAKKDVVYLNISSESALQYILTAGAVMPRSQARSGDMGMTPEMIAAAMQSAEQKESQEMRPR